VGRKIENKKSGTWYR